MRGLLIFLIIFVAIVAIVAVIMWYKRNSQVVGTATSLVGTVTSFSNLFKRR